jgi:hypothetical protein
MERIAGPPHAPPLLDPSRQAVGRTQGTSDTQATPSTKALANMGVFAYLPKRCIRR